MEVDSNLAVAVVAARSLQLLRLGSRVEMVAGSSRQVVVGEEDSSHRVAGVVDNNQAAEAAGNNHHHLLLLVSHSLLWYKMPSSQLIHQIAPTVSGVEYLRLVAVSSAIFAATAVAYETHQR